MKKHELIFSAIKVPLDFLIIFFTFFIAREIRLITDLIPGIQLPIQTINTTVLGEFAIFGASLYVLILAFHGLYSIQIFHSKIKEFLEIIRYGIYSLIFFSVFIYLGNGILYETQIPRLIVIFTFVIGTILVILERIFLNNLQYSLLKRGKIPKRKLILVNNKSYSQLSDILHDIKLANIYEVIGYINKLDLKIKSLDYLGSLEETESLFQNKQVDEILDIDSDYSKKQRLELWELSKIFGIRYRYLTNIFDVTQTNSTLGLLGRIPVIEIKNTPLENWGKIIKRIFDIFSGVIGLILLSPILFLVAIAIKIEDPKGPILYKNRRSGEKNKEFNLYKFRYMKWEYCVKDAYGVHQEKDKALAYEKELIETQSTRSGPLYKIKNDPRKTKIGNFIEKYSIDELPQFFNIIIGNMSLVGPRPHQPREVEKYSLDQRRLLTIKPGITGMAQVNGRDENDFKKEAQLDIFYIENWNFLLDLKIILKTFSVIIERIKK